jgi:ATP-dependent Lon protease
MFFGRDDKKDQKKTLSVPLLPLRDIIVFPHMVVPLFVGREKSIAALDEAMTRDKSKEIFLAAQKNARTNEPEPDDIYSYGTLGTIMQMVRLPDGTVKVLVEGRKRARLKRFVQTDEHFVVEVEEVEEPKSVGLEVEALVRSVLASFETYVKLNKKVEPEVLVGVQATEDPSQLADAVMRHLATVKLTDRQELLETEDVRKRLERLHEIMQAEIEIMQVERKIRTRVKKQMEKTQKEYYLNEQMAAIQRELGGDRDDARSGSDDALAFGSWAAAASEAVTHGDGLAMFRGALSRAEASLLREELLSAIPPAKRTTRVFANHMCQVRSPLISLGCP